MKKKILFLALSIILSFKSFSQIVFEDGYYINHSNQKIECLIKNIDWKNNPTEFEFKLSRNTPAQKASIETVKEFGINGVSKYIRTTVKIDRSTDKIDKLSSEKDPNFLEEKLFLEVLIEGGATLFLYEYRNLKRFFYSLNNSEIKQLVYKRYHIGHYIGQNNYFKQQLFTDLKCQDIKLDDVENVKYSKWDLEKFFMKFNECTSGSYINYKFREKKELFNLSFRPGLNESNLSIQSFIVDTWDIDFNSEFNFRFGIEAEFILPFNKDKWSIIVEPTYQQYKSEKETEMSDVPDGILVSKTTYQSIELPIGVRHYFFLNNTSKIFVNISHIWDFNNNSSIDFKGIDPFLLTSLEIKSRNNLAFGFGYKYKDRYSVEMRYQTNREILSDYLDWQAKYRTASIIFGYSIF